TDSPQKDEKAGSKGEEKYEIGKRLPVEYAYCHHCHFCKPFDGILECKSSNGLSAKAKDNGKYYSVNGVTVLKGKINFLFFIFR
ncbi:MAG: hypothetical protein MJ252_10000, partial [archaeon]|nr:hypothetical protein [archaeon]